MTPVERDAARYRWLREGDNDEPVLRYTNGKPFPVLQPDETGPAYLLRLHNLDAAIDAAMEAECKEDAEIRYTITEAGRALLAGKS